MPSRYIRADYLDSEIVGMASEAGEVTFLRLMLVADDFGRFDGRLTVICRKCWPLGLDKDPKADEIEKRLQHLEHTGLIVRYEVDGKPFIFIPKFKQRTRANKSKYPDPPRNDGRMPDMPQTDDGQPSGTWRAADGPPQARSVSRSVSISRDARAPEIPVDKPETPPQAFDRLNGRPATPPTGESPTEFLKRHTKRQDPFAEPDRAEGAGT